MRRIVLDAAFDEFAENGLAGATIAAVARRSGVHQTTIYRQWVTRENLFVDALLDRSAEAIPAPDTGSTRGDLLAIFRTVIAYATSPAGTAVLHAAMLPAEDSYAAARHAFWSTRYDEARPVVQRGIERGDLRADTDPRLLLEIMVAPLYGRLLLTGEPIEDDLPERIVDLLLDGAAVESRANEHRGRPCGDS